MFTARYELDLLNKTDYVSFLKGPTTVTAHYGDKLRSSGWREKKKTLKRQDSVARHATRIQPENWLSCMKANPVTSRLISPEHGQFWGEGRLILSTDHFLNNEEGTVTRGPICSLSVHSYIFSVSIDFRSRLSWNCLYPTCLYCLSKVLVLFNHTVVYRHQQQLNYWQTAFTIISWSLGVNATSQ